MIELRKISHGFENSAPVLTNVNLAMRRGESFVMVGPSGQGKSTLLKILSGLIAPTKGEVLIEEKNLYTCSRFERQETMNKIGMLFQKNALFDSLTVGENLAFPLRETFHLTEKEISNKVMKFLAAVGLGGKENLDPITSRMIIELIIKLNRELKATSIAITNDMNRAYQLADRMGVLMEHTLTVTGSVEETKKFPNPEVQKFIRGEFPGGSDVS